MYKLLFTLFILIQLPAFAQKSMHIKEALDQKKIKANYVAKGGAFGESLRVNLENISNSPINVQIPAGTQFISQDEWVQDLVVLKTKEIFIHSKRMERIELYTACTEMNRCSPVANQIFTLNPKRFVNDTLMFLIDEFDYHVNYTSQYAIWTMLGQTEGIFDLQDSVARKYIHVFENAQIPVQLSEDGGVRIGRSITFINTSLPSYINDYLEDASLKAYDQEGKLFRQYSIPNRIEPGFHHFKVGLNHRLGDSTSFTLKLEHQGKVIAEKEVYSTDSIPEYHSFKKKLETSFELKKTYDQARAGLYDSKGRLCVLLQDNFKAKRGLFVSRFSWEKKLPQLDSLYFRLTAGNKIIYERLYNLSKNNLYKYDPIVKRGLINVHFQDYVNGAKLAVYNEQEQLIWTVFEESFLGHGKRQLSYAFKHTEGPDATFFVRLFDGEGILLVEKKI